MSKEQYGALEKTIKMFIQKKQQEQTEKKQEISVYIILINI